MILFAITFGVDISAMISNWIQSGVEVRKEKHEERMIAREEYEEARRQQQIKAHKEGKRAKTIKENRKAYLEIEDDNESQKEIQPEQIKINLNGRTIEEESNNNRGRKKFKHEKDDLVRIISWRIRRAALSARIKMDSPLHFSGGMKGRNATPDPGRIL